MTDIVYEFNGGITWSEVHEISAAERNRFITYINKKAQDKTGKEWM
jgi:hypothetical protein